MKRFFKWGFLLISLSILFTFNSANVRAAGEHQFSFKAYNCNSLNEDYACTGPNNNPDEELPEIVLSEGVKAGQVIKLSLYYVPGTDAALGFQVGINYDPTLIDSNIADGEFYAETIEKSVNDGGVWPAAGITPTTKNKTNWKLGYNNVVSENLIMFTADDDQMKSPMTTEGIVFSFYVKVKDDVPDGTPITFEINSDETSMMNKSAVQGTNYSVTVGGGGSTPTPPTSLTLNTLNVTGNGTPYTLTPTFVPDDATNKDYSTVVPNNVSSIDIGATSTATSGVTITGDGNNKSLNIGNNPFPIAITNDKDGTVETYTLSVYRLNNDATLNTLSASGITFNETFVPGSDTPSDFTATVPNSTTSTTLSATPTDSKATIENQSSVLGSWTLSNSGTTNNKTITVKAENCDTKYSSVPGNTCNKKDYSIAITRTKAATDATLTTFTIDGIDPPGFVMNTAPSGTFNLNPVPYSTSSVTVNATVNDTMNAKIIAVNGSTITPSASYSNTINLTAGTDNEIKIKVQAEDTTVTQEYIAKVRRKSNDNRLGNLNVTSNPQGTLSPSFSASSDGPFTYTVSKNVNTVTVSASANTNSNATVDIDGSLTGSKTYDLSTASSATITVTAEDTTIANPTKTYVINFVKGKSSVAQLSQLYITGLPFSNKTFSPTDLGPYEVTVASTVTSVDIHAEAADDGTIDSTSQIGNQTLSGNETTYSIKVNSEDGKSSNTYTIKVKKSQGTSATLSSISVDGTQISGFSSSNFGPYSLSNVSYSKDSVVVTAVAENNGSYTVANENPANSGIVKLNTGPNTITVTAISEDGSASQPYTISIEREHDTNYFLEYIKVDGKSIGELSHTTFDYYITVENNITNLAELNLNAKPESDDARVTSITPDHSTFSTDDDNIISITVMAGDGHLQLYKLHVTRKKSSDAYLTNILTNISKLNEPFVQSDDGLSYTIDVDRSITSIELTPVKKANQVVSGPTGPTTLSLGNNIYTIVVEAEDGLTSKTYTVTVNRKKSDNTLLSDITIDGTIIPGFNPTTKVYNLNSSNYNSPIDIQAHTQEEHAVILSESNIGSQTIVTGQNSFYIYVRAEDGTENRDAPYVININKPLSNNTDLINLNTSQGLDTPGFNPNDLKPSYTATVPYSVTSIDITAKAKDSGAVVKINGALATNQSDWSNLSLSTGSNTYNIVVTAEDGNTSRSYTLTVTRSKNNNAKLQTLTVTGADGPIAFEEGTFDGDNTYNYTLKLPNKISSITLSSTPQDPNALGADNMGIHNNIPTGISPNPIVITSTAEDGVTTVKYNIYIEREKLSDATLKELVPSVGSFNETFVPSDSSHINYTMSVSNETSAISFSKMVPTDPNVDPSTIIVTGNTGFQVGDQNYIHITVTADDGTSLTYIIQVTREQEADNYLGSLSVVDDNNKEYITDNPFDKLKKTYTIDVENDIDAITISATAESADVAAPTGTGRKTLSVGKNSPFKVTVTSTSGVTREYEIIVTRKSDSNTYLSALSVDSYTFDNNKAFIKTDDSYPLTVDSSVSNLTINATPESSTSKILDSDDNIVANGDPIVVSIPNSGLNTITIKVKAQDGTIGKYYINVYKKSSDNNYASTIKIDNKEIETPFDKTKDKYEIEVDDTVTTLNVFAEAEDVANGATVVSGIGNTPLNTDTTLITIVVRSQSGKDKSYTILVKRKKSNDTRLSDLTVDGITVNGFVDKNSTGPFTYNVANTVDSVNVVATANDPKRLAVIGNRSYDLHSGDNTIQITVVAEDGTTGNYELKINKQKSSNALLKELSVLEGILTPNNNPFDPTETNYSLTVPNEVTKLNVTAIPEDEEHAKVTIQGYDNLAVTTQTVTIEVTAEDGTTGYYYINVTRQPNATNYLNDLKVKDKDGVEYELKPGFSRTGKIFEVELPATVTEVEIETLHDATFDVEGDGPVSITGLPQDHEVKVIPRTNKVPRSYYIHFVKGLSKNTNLLNLSVNPGSLDKTFDPDSNQSYEVNLANDASTIDITATKAEDTQTISGDIPADGIGKNLPLPNDRNKFDITVTSEFGNVKTYTIFVNKKSKTEEDDNVLETITVDKGDLKPAFDSDTHTYAVYLDPEETEISINATGKYNVTGQTGLQTLQSGVANTFIINSVKDGKENSYKVIVINGKIESTALADLSIKDQKLNETFVSSDVNYTSNIESTLSSIDVIPVPLDKDATVKVNGAELNSNGSATVGLTSGVNTITITVEKAGLETTTYTITASSFLDKIISSIHTIDESYIRTAKPQTAISAFKPEFDNPSEHLKFYDKDDNEVIDETSIVKTGMKIKLIIDGKEYDSKLIVIKGDVNGDGRVAVNDYINLGEHLGKSITLTGAYFEAAKINPDDRVAVNDYIKLGEHLGKSINIFEEE